MKVLTQEDEKALNSAVLSAGIKASAVGLAVGLGSVMFANRRYPAFRNMTLPFKSFLVSSTATAFGVTAADHASVEFDRSNNEKIQHLRSTTAKLEAQIRAAETPGQKFMRWGKDNRYKIVVGTWLAGMGAAWHYVGKDKYMSTSQKVVQARVYAQGLTLAVLIATAAFEMNDAKKGEGRYETILVVDPDHPDHLIEKKVHKEAYTGQDLWKEMVAAEEKRLEGIKKSKEPNTKPEEQQ